MYGRPVIHSGSAALGRSLHWLSHAEQGVSPLGLTEHPS